MNKSIEERIELIEKRNKQVENDKAWETSLTRKLLIIIFTYIALALYFKYVLDVEPLLNAIVPTLGFFLGTLSLPFARSIWEKFRKR